jgi:hypothetical protein
MKTHHLGSNRELKKLYHEARKPDNWQQYRLMLPKVINPLTKARA